MISRQKPKLPSNALRIFLSLLHKNKLLDGDYVKVFEQEFSRYLDVRHTILVSSGRVALYLILKQLGINYGDEVIVPSFTCPVVPSVLVGMGIKPIFVDVDAETFNINPFLIESCLTGKTKAVVATHIEGQPCDMGSINKIAVKYNLKIIEDCAQALGAEYNGRKVGSIGDVGYFSFAMGKQINTRGGGAIVTNNDYLAEEIRNIIAKYALPKRSGIIKKFVFMYLVSLGVKYFLFNLFIFPLIYLSNLFGKDIINLLFEDKGVLGKFTDKYCVKYSNLQAAIGLENLKKIDADNNKRIMISSILDKNITLKIKRQQQIKGIKSIHLYYSVLLDNRLEVKRKLLNYGIDTQESWNVSCSSLELFRQYYKDCPVADKLSRTSLYIPNYPDLDEKNACCIANGINAAVG